MIKQVVWSSKWTSSSKPKHFCQNLEKLCFTKDIFPGRVKELNDVVKTVGVTHVQLDVFIWNRFHSRTCCQCGDVSCSTNACMSLWWDVVSVLFSLWQCRLQGQVQGPRSFAFISCLHMIHTEVYVHLFFTSSSGGSGGIKVPFPILFPTHPCTQKLSSFPTFFNLT